MGDIETIRAAAVELSIVIRKLNDTIEDPANFYDEKTCFDLDKVADNIESEFLDMKEQLELCS